MDLGREVREPWAIVLGGLAAGMGWAVGVPLLGAAGIGAAVYATRVAIGVVVDRSRSVEGMPEIRAGSPQAYWLSRGRDAVRALERQGAGLQPGPLADRVARMAADADDLLDDLRRLAGHSTRVDIALGHVDQARLDEESNRLETELSMAADKELRAEIQRSVDSIRSQLAVRTRLVDAAAKLQARIEAVVIGLESIVTRLVEILATMPTQPPEITATSVDALANELDGWRAGLAETEEVSRRALVAYAGQAVPTTSKGGRGLRSWFGGETKADDAAELRDSLDTLLRSVRGRVPDDIYALVASIRDSILLTIPENAAESAAATDPNVYLIRQTALDYLPAALQSYLSLPAQYADRPITADGRTPHATLLDQLQLMDGKMREVADAIVRHDSDRLVANGRFLHERFSTSSLDLGAGVPPQSMAPESKSDALEPAATAPPGTRPGPQLAPPRTDPPPS